MCLLPIDFETNIDETSVWIPFTLVHVLMVFVGDAQNILA